MKTYVLLIGLQFGDEILLIKKEDDNRYNPCKPIFETSVFSSSPGGIVTASKCELMTKRLSTALWELYKRSPYVMYTERKKKSIFIRFRDREV